MKKKFISYIYIVVEYDKLYIVSFFKFVIIGRYYLLGEVGIFRSGIFSFVYSGELFVIRVR